ncbi:MAG: carboxypeptidase-like regulatory domain-containing protein [Desulfuromonadales bacterium]|nr:carboxypeptidase-like regulatory domain-containing protein [Desulfuromonadales bacterium]
MRLRFWTDHIRPPLASLLLLLLLLAAPALAATVTGKASVADQPTAGVRVAAYPATVLDFTAAPAAQSAVTAADGLFALDLPAGEYYLLAAGAGLFSFYGRNPIAVPAEGLTDINLPLTPAEPPAPDLTSTVESGIVGRVERDGQPVAGARVMVYPDLSSQLKGMGLAISLPSDGDGFFELPLPAGRYYLVARLRQAGGMAGPLKAGDLFGYPAANPVQVTAGEIVRLRLPVIAVPANVQRHAATLFGTTRITGRIVDSHGAPVAGLIAMLYDDSSMLSRPLYVSAPTGGDGRFSLSFPQGGTYFLAARNELGGTPEPGELYGRYQGDDGRGVTVEAGQTLDQIVIVVEEVY